MPKYQVYVIELSKRVFTEHTRFRDANPQFIGVVECLYVGMTSKTPEERFKQHMTGYVSKRGYNISSALVMKYGRYLRPSLYDQVNINPMNKKEALANPDTPAPHSYTASTNRAATAKAAYSEPANHALVH